MDGEFGLIGVHAYPAVVFRPHFAIITADGGERVGWLLFKADHESAYKQLPIRPADMKNASVALRHHSKGSRFVFVTRTLIFGSVAAVIRYNVFFAYFS